MAGRSAALSGLLVTVASVVASVASAASAATLAVGPGRQFARIEDAHRRAGPGDTVLVFPLPDGTVYEGAAVFVTQPRLTFMAARRRGDPRVAISGKGFDYSGAGSVPRAIFQFNRGADGCVVEGFAISGAHNGSHNGAAVRVNQASHVAIRDCEIHGCDMGMMSNSDGTQATMADLVVEGCVIHHNGSFEHPGYNHNLYVGGTSLTLRFCEVHSSLTGHNVKSRAHHTRIEYCYVHDSANREMDLVDAEDTARPESHAVLVGNVIVKDPKCRGNRTVIHFGQDGGKGHDGTIYLVHNTIVTPFVSPVVDLSAKGARASFVGNVVWDGGAREGGQRLVSARGKAELPGVTGGPNWLSSGFAASLAGLKGTGLDPARQTFGPAGAKLPFAGPDDYRLALPVRGIADAGVPLAGLAVPPVPGAPPPAQPVQPGANPPGAGPTPATPTPILAWQYRHPASGEKREIAGPPDLGAHECIPR